uniref:Mitochondrial glycoprotein n=1 Tax=Leersia perrieri TaxID=77586 RepID=A0A0D9X8A0_9ORYZ
MARRLLHLRGQVAGLSRHCSGEPARLLPTRPYISDMRRSAFSDRLLRALRSEISCRGDPTPLPPRSTAPFAVDDRPGNRWSRLRPAFPSAEGEEEVRVDATMVDGATFPTRFGAGPDGDGDERPPRMHISVHVEVSRAARPDMALAFECAAWPDEMEVERVYPLRRGMPAPAHRYMGRPFRELDEEMQSAVHDYLEHRGVNDELAAYLHSYMENKEQTELVRWLKNVECIIKK